MLTVGGAPATKHMTEAQRHKYIFWDTQPVPKISKFFSCFVFVVQGDRVIGLNYVSKVSVLESVKLRLL